MTALLKKIRKLFMLPVLVICLSLSAVLVYADSDDPLCLTDCWPSDGSQDVNTTVEFTLTFMFNVAEEELRANNTAAITAEDEAGGIVPVTVSYSEMFVDRRKIFVSFQNLEPETTYILTVDPLLRAKNGKTLDETVQIHFTTKKLEEEEIKGPEEEDEEINNEEYNGIETPSDSPPDVYAEPEESEDGGDDITVVAQDGGNGEDLYTGNEGDENAPGPGDSKGNGNKTKEKARGGGGDAPKGEEEGDGDGQMDGNGDSVGSSQNMNVKGTTAIAKGEANESGDAEIEVADVDAPPESEPETPPQEPPEEPEEPEDPPEDDKEEPEEGQELPKFTPYQKKEVSYLALIVEVILVGFSIVTGVVMKRGKRIIRKV